MSIEYPGMMNHGAALTVPTWTTFPRLGQLGLSPGFAAFQSAVKWIAFLVINLNALTCAKLIKIRPESTP